MSISLINKILFRKNVDLRLRKVNRGYSVMAVDTNNNKKILAVSTDEKLNDALLILDVKLGKIGK